MHPHCFHFPTQQPTTHAGKRVKLTCDQEGDAVNPEAQEDLSAAELPSAQAGGQQAKGERRFRGQRVETPSHPGEIRMGKFMLHGETRPRKAYT